MNNENSPEKRFFHKSFAVHGNLPLSQKNQWQEFFDGHAPIYMENVFTKNTLEEVNFILNELKLPEGGTLLDMGCGTGRHSIELAKRGYKVTGVDLSPGMLREAKKRAREQGVTVEWIQSDATRFTAPKQFDAGICLCEGAFCLLGMSEDPIEHDLAILKNIYSALKPGAGFILTALSGYRKIRQYTPEDVKKGIFDPITLTETTTMDWDTPEGKKSVQVRERGYVPLELKFLFQQVGFEVTFIGGGTAGNWGRRPLELDEWEIMIIAKKPG